MAEFQQLKEHRNEFVHSFVASHPCANSYIAQTWTPAGIITLGSIPLPLPASRHPLPLPASRPPLIIPHSEPQGSSRRLGFYPPTGSRTRISISSLEPWAPSNRFGSAQKGGSLSWTAYGMKNIRHTRTSSHIHSDPCFRKATPRLAAYYFLFACRRRRTIGSQLRLSCEHRRLRYMTLW